MEPRKKQLLRRLALMLAAVVPLSACKLYIPETEGGSGEGDVSFSIQETPHQEQFGADLAIDGVELAIEAVELERTDGEVVDVAVDVGTAFDLMPPNEVEDPSSLSDLNSLERRRVVCGA